MSTVQSAVCVAACRYVLVMLTYVNPYTNSPEAPPADPSLLVMVSATNDPTGDWVIKAVLSNVPQNTGLGLYCNNSYWLTADYPQVDWGLCY